MPDLPAELPANYETGQLFTAMDENTVETAINEGIVAIQDLQAVVSTVSNTGYSQLIGDSISTSIEVIHNLGTTQVLIGVWEASTGLEVNCDKTRTDPNTIVLTFAVAPSPNAYRVEVIAGGLGLSSALSPTVAESLNNITTLGQSLLTSATFEAAQEAIGIIGGARSPMIGQKIRGGNITVKPGHFWSHLFSEWDWTNWIKPQVDRAVKLGMNAIRLIGSPLSVLYTSGNPTWATWAANTAYAVDKLIVNGTHVYLVTTAGTSASSGGPTGTGSAITDGTVVWSYYRENNLGPITQSQYDAQWSQLAQYCATNGLYLYPCLITTADCSYRGVGYQDAAATASVLTTAASLAKYPNVIGFDLFQEGDVLAMAWLPNTAYGTGDNSLAYNGGLLYQCITPGTSASSGGPTGTGSSITDGSVVWKYVKVPLLATDVLAMMAAVRGVCNVPLTMSVPFWTGVATSWEMFSGSPLIWALVNSDPAGADFLDLHIYDSNITTDQFNQYIGYYNKPVLVGEFGVGQDSDSGTQSARYTVPKAVHARPGVLGSLVWALADQGVNNPANLYGVWDNTGFVQANSVATAAPLSTSSGQRASLGTLLRQFVPARPQNVVSPSSPVCVTAVGDVGTENGSNTWAKILTVSTGSEPYADVQLLLAVVNADTGHHDSAVVSVKFRANGIGSTPVVDAQIIAKGGQSGFIVADSFKVISGAFGTNMELWVKKALQYGQLFFYELSRCMTGLTNPIALPTLTYTTNPAWQSAVPTGAVNNASSSGVTAFGATVADISTAQTFINKTLTSPKINQLLDTNGNSILSLAPVSSAVNFVSVNNAIAGNGPNIIAQGSDTNVDLNLTPQGTGAVKIRASSGQALTVVGVASSVNFATITNSITGQPVLFGAYGSDTDVHLNLVPKGAGTVQAKGIVVADISTAQTLTNKTLTTPRISNILDGSGAEILALTGQVSAVNYLQIWNGPATIGPQLLAQGLDTNISIYIQTKGTGSLGIVQSGTGVTPRINATGVDTDVSLNLVSKGAGVVQANGNPVGVRVAVPTTATSAGAPGQFAVDTTYIYACVATNSWVRSTAAAW